MSRQPAGSELTAALAQIRKAHDCIDELAAGGELERVDAGLLKRDAQRVLATLRDRSEALAKRTIVRIHEELLAGFGVLHHKEPEIRQLHFQWIVQSHRNRF